MRLKKMLGVVESTSAPYGLNAIYKIKNFATSASLQIENPLHNRFRHSYRKVLYTPQQAEASIMNKQQHNSIAYTLNGV